MFFFVDDSFDLVVCGLSLLHLWIDVVFVVEMLCWFVCDAWGC